MAVLETWKHWASPTVCSWTGLPSDSHQALGEGAVAHLTYGEIEAPGLSRDLNCHSSLADVGRSGLRYLKEDVPGSGRKGNQPLQHLAEDLLAPWSLLCRHSGFRLDMQKPI